MCFAQVGRPYMSAPGNLANERKDQPSASALAQLHELRNELEQVRSARKPTSQFPALTFLLIVLLVGLFLYFIYDQTNRFTALGNTLDPPIKTSHAAASIGEATARSRPR
jgi:hypothetical protein